MHFVGSMGIKAETGMGIVPKNKKILSRFGRIVLKHGRGLTESVHESLYNNIIKELPVICKRNRKKGGKEGVAYAWEDSTASVP